jgi:hypothetical protein
MATLYPLAVPFAARDRSLLATNFETVGEGSNRFRPNRSRRSFRPESLVRHEKGALLQWEEDIRPVAVAPTGSSRRGHCW